MQVKYQNCHVIQGEWLARQIHSDAKKRRIAMLFGAVICGTIMHSDTLIKQLYEAFPLRTLPTQVAGKRTIYDDEYSYVEEFFHGRG